MATDKRITELTDLTTPNNADLLTIVDDVSGTPITKKITVGNLFGGTSVNYGEMYFNNNSTVTVIETADTPIAIKEFTVGLLNDWTYTAGSTGAITAYADYGGTVAGTVKATDAGHGLATDDVISIRGTTNYNGIFQITVIDSDNFYFTDTWVNDNVASDWDQGDYLTVATDGTYKISWDISASEGGGAGSTLTYAVYVNATIEDRSRIQRKFPNNDIGAFGGHSFVTLSAGDIVFITASSSGTNDMTHSYGALSVKGV